MARLSVGKRVGEVEFFRFVFAVAIAFFHSSNLLGTRPIFKNGASAVEFFFLVSGYLLMASVEKLREKPIDNLGRETVGFVLGRIKPIYLDVVIGYVLGFTFRCISTAPSAGSMWSLFRKSVFEVLLVQRTGLGSNKINAAIWYVQSMLLCFCILYPLIRKFPRMMKQVILPLGALLLVGWLIRSEGSLRTPTEWLGFTYKGNVRAMGMLCAGAVCYGFTQRLKALSLTVFARICLMVVKWGCWALSIGYLMTTKSKYDDFYVLVLCVAVVLTFSQQCIDTKLFQNRFCILLGKISLPLYLNHMYLARNLKHWVPKDMERWTKFAIYLACVVVATAVAMLLSAGLRKAWPYMKKGFSRLLIKPQPTE